MMTVTADITIPPDAMAWAFWNMCAAQQVEFFAHLAKVIKADQTAGNRNAYSFGELQWFFTGDELLKDENQVAREMLMAMAAPLYLHTLRTAEALK